MARRDSQGRICAVFVLMAVAAIGSPTAHAAAPSAGGPVDLLTEANITIAGAGPNDLIGRSVGNAGDVNGDGLDDVILGDPYDDAGGGNSGEAYVAFGQPQPGTIDVGQLGQRGFRIQGAGSFDMAGVSVNGAGDVNGDGYGDVIVGAWLAGGEDAQGPGAAYVIFGGPVAADVDLAALDGRGFTIDGVRGLVGGSVDGAGDVNGDGLADVVVGAPGDCCNEGGTFVVFGKQDTAPVRLNSLGDAGFAIASPVIPSNAPSGGAVGGAGDVNGDGLADVVIGILGAAPGGRFSAGSAFVVYGKPTTETVRLDALGTQGFRIEGAEEFDNVGVSVAGAGDVNGDGFSDVVVAATGAGGVGYVVYGGVSTTVELGSLGGRGFRILGVKFGFGESPQKVDTAGDFNDDGFDDVILGSPRDPSAFANGRPDAGAAYVVYGSTAPTEVDATAIAGRGIRIDGPEAGARAGESVGGGGDSNGDGAPDVIVGAFGADPLARTDAGAGYLVFGFKQRPTSHRDCQRNGWKRFGFRNQGACVRFVRTGS